MSDRMDGLRQRLDALVSRWEDAEGARDATVPAADRTALIELARDVLQAADDVHDRERRMRETVHAQTRAWEQKVLELSILKRLGDLVAGSLRVDDLLDRVLVVLLDELPAENASILLLDPESGELTLHAGRGHDGVPDGGTQAAGLRSGEGIAGCVAATREPLIVPDVSRDLRFRPGGQGTARGSLVSVPLLAGERVLGVLNLSAPDTGVFAPGHVRILRIAAGQVASALVGSGLHRELREFSDSLESTVEERTSELRRRTEDLRRKNDQITELYLSLEEAQHELEKRHRELLDAATFQDNLIEAVGVGIGVVDHEERIVAWNRAMGEITGGRLAKDVVMGRRLEELPAGVRAEFALDRPLADALRSGRPVRLRDHRVESPGGGTLHLNIHHRPVSIAADGSRQVLTVIEDVSANVERHDERVKGERLAAITATMVSVNHEVNNPLAVILGYAQMLLREAEAAGEGADPRLKRFLVRMEREALRIRDITRKLATLAEPVLTEYPSSEGNVRMVDVGRSR